MKKSSVWPLIIAVGVIALIAGGTLFYIFRPVLEIQISVSDLGKIKQGDKVYMSGQAIGEVKVAKLEKQGKGTIKAEIYDDYKQLINQTAVFTITSDRLLTGRKCMQVKNCKESGLAIEKGQEFKGYGRFRYEVACFESKASEAWEGYLKEMVKDAVTAAGKLTDEAIEQLKKFEAEHHDEFVAWLNQMKKEVEELTPEIKRQLEELLKELDRPTDSAPGHNTKPDPSEPRKI